LPMPLAPSETLTQVALLVADHGHVPVDCTSIFTSSGRYAERTERRT